MTINKIKKLNLKKVLLYSSLNGNNSKHMDLSDIDFNCILQDITHDHQHSIKCKFLKMYKLFRFTNSNDEISYNIVKGKGTRTKKTLIRYIDFA